MKERWVLIPLKSLHGGKERLSGVLSEPQRGELITAMLVDLIRALLAVPVSAARILLVTEDEAARRLANLHGIVHFKPSPARSDPLNAALLEASSFVTARDGREILIVHADVPYASADDFRAAIAAHQAHCETHAACVTLISDRAGEGSNCLLVTPPDAIAFHFGSESRARHAAACESAGVAYREFVREGLARDIDLPDEIATLRRDCLQGSAAVGAATRAVVCRWSCG